MAPGSTGDTLAGGAGFSIDLTSAVAAIGSVEGFAVLGLNTAETTGLASYNYDEFLYVAAGGGLVYAGSATGRLNKPSSGKCDRRHSKLLYCGKFGFQR